MYIFSFFIVLGAVTYFTNKQNDVESNYEFLKWDRKEIIIISGTIGLAIVLQMLDFIIPKIFILAYIVAAVIAILYVNKMREQYIQEYKQQISQVVEATDSLINVKEIDYNNIPFKIERDGDLINKITVQIDKASRFNDGNCINAVYSLKKFFPYYDWQYTCDFPKQVCVFEGQKLPPGTALFPGSDLRKSTFIPLGVSGNGEVGWALSGGDYGDSEYVFEDGKKAGTVQLSYAPQALTLGATGGGKSVWVGQEIW